MRGAVGDFISMVHTCMTYYMTLSNRKVNYVRWVKESTASSAAEEGCCWKVRISITHKCDLRICTGGGPAFTHSCKKSHIFRPILQGRELFKA